MANIREKIQKLLALSSSPNQHEARAALLKAKELMIKHKLSEADFEEVKKQEFKQFQCDDIRWTTDSGRVWMTRLCKVLCDEYMCTAAWFTPNGSRTHILVMSGMSEDLEICKSVVGYAVGFVESAIEELWGKYRRSASNRRAIANSYAEGFILGLELAFQEQRTEHPEWALVVVKPEEVTKYEESLGSRTVKTKKDDFNPLAYTKGQVDGKNFNTRKVIGEC